MKNLEPNTQVKCIAKNPMFVAFTYDHVYQINENGLIIDNDGDPREVVSTHDKYFYATFLYIK